MYINMIHVHMIHVHVYIQDGETALYFASQVGHGPVVELLLQTEHTDVNISRKV